jgi:DNA topoisomerase-1
MIVNDFLVEHFGVVLDYSFTATVEKDFDEIANGKKQWNKMIGSFYKEFHPLVEVTEKLDRKDVGGSRELGNDPKTGLPIIARLGRFGPLVQMGEQLEEGEEGEGPKFASMRKGQLIESITLEEALELFKLPRTVGEYEDKVVVVAIGRFGPYVRHDGKFVSLPKEDDPMTVSAERAIELIELKRKSDAEKHIKSFDENPDVQVLNGRYGPYIKVGKQNVKIPKDKEPASLTLAECLELAENAPVKKGRGAKTVKKATPKKVAKKAPKKKK